MFTIDRILRFFGYNQYGWVVVWEAPAATPVEEPKEPEPTEKPYVPPHQGCRCWCHRMPDIPDLPHELLCLKTSQAEHPRGQVYEQDY